MFVFIHFPPELSLVSEIVSRDGITYKNSCRCNKKNKKSCMPGFASKTPCCLGNAKNCKYNTCHNVSYNNVGQA